MCILCVLQRASRRARNMLPWLVLVLVGLWAVSQLLPPPFCLEITASRLACVLFLAGYFSWYEFLLPQLSLWRARRSARLRERRWSQAVELQKLRKAATRRCRNCLNPYKDQNPGGGRFMCSYCGHISKRPVLDIPGPPGSAGMIGDILGRNAWICSQDWPSEGSANWRYGITSGDDHCLTERTYSDAAVFTCKLFSSIFFCVRWLGGWIFRFGSSRDDSSADEDDQGLSGRGENGGNYQESRVEKSRRKAEEKRRARLEKEMLEEEERKQREEVAKLMEEQRKLRDEKSESKKEQSRDSERMQDAKKDSEKKKQERRKDKDRGSSKSNSEGEETEKKSGSETEKKRDLDKRVDIERRDIHKSGTESNKTHATEVATQVAKGVSKSQYFDRVKGSFLSTSRGFRNANFFGKASQDITVTATKLNKQVSGLVEQTSNLNRKEIPFVAQMSGRQTAGVDESVSSHQPTVINSPPPTNVWKKSWHQLFTVSSASNTSSNKGIDVSEKNGESTQLSPLQGSSSCEIDSQTHLNQPFPCNQYTQMIDPAANISNLSSDANCLHPFGVSTENTITEENEFFDDPCYVPDPNLMAPVSESLDNSPWNVGAGFASNGIPYFRKSSAIADGNKPSPIESPLSRLRMSGNKDGPPSSVKALDSFSTSCGASSTTTSEPGVWQMWGTPLAQESLNILGISGNRVLPMGKTKQEQESIMHPLAHDRSREYTSEENLAQFGILSSRNEFVASPRNDGLHSLLERETDPWLESSILQPLSSNPESQFPPFKLSENIIPTNSTHHDQGELRAGHVFGVPLSECLFKSDWDVTRTNEYGNAPASEVPMGCLFPTNSGVKPVWAFK